MSDKVSEKQGVPLKNFKDSGTQKRYFAGKAAAFSEGEYRNYVAARLVADPASDEGKAAVKDAGRETIEIRSAAKPAAA